jgi:flagellar assembly protein FliH
MSSERDGIQGNGSRTEPFLYLPAGSDAGAQAVGGDAEFHLNMLGSVAQSSLEKQSKETFERGVQEGQSAARSSYEKLLAAMQASVAGALESFRSQRESYFTRIEPEVVQLALAIARKILHREAQMDPLLLTGMVHVALEKIDAGTRVRLHAHPSDVHFWNEYFAQADSSQSTPEIVGDPALQHGECALETEIGNTQISLETQLKEIEQGFFDLLGQCPRVR